MDAVGGGAFAVSVDYSAAAPGVMARVSHDGRTGRSVSTPDGCQIELQRQYTVAGATVPFYLDPSTKLPDAEDMASATSPGWEDWDWDGHPGITGVCAGTVSGRLFTAARDWVTLSGNVANVALPVFRLEMDWDQEQNVMAFDGSPFLGTSAVRAADSRLHFAQFARLTEPQAAGDDQEMCSQLVELAPTLTPEAAGM
jgi:hypothetical protein